MKIALLGDIAPFGRYCIHKNPDVLTQFEGVRSFLRTHDLVVGNLEVPFTDDERPAGAKSAHIRSHPKNIELLRYLGVTHVTLANNHIGDFGLAGYRRTKAVLESAGIEWFGAEKKTIRLELDGEKVALIGYCSLNTNPARVGRGGVQLLNLLDVDPVLADLQRECLDGYFPILAVHSGQEHVHTPSSEDVKFARGLASKFDYIYYGHHPHVVQGSEVIGNSVAFYSLGNFVFDDVYTSRDTANPLVRMSKENKTGAMASLTLDGGKIASWSIVPIYLGEERVDIGDDVVGFDAKPYNDALAAAGTPEYDDRRAGLINDYIQSRRALRDLKWYWRRLSLNSLGIILAARKNAGEHRNMFSSKLSRLGG